MLLFAGIFVESACVLNSLKPNPGNLNLNEFSALKTLSNHDDIIILAANKGNTTVVIDKSIYDCKLEALLNDGPYTSVKTDPKKRFRKQF